MNYHLIRCNYQKEKALDMKIPQHVRIVKEEKDIKLYHYTDDATHPGATDYWKGIVLDGASVIARSYPWSPSVVTDVLPGNMLYTPLYEATILRFYRIDGKPVIGTHRQINVTDKACRVSPNTRPFFELVQQAISAWEYKEYEYTTYDGRNGMAFTPSSWEDLCIEGWCHVFLLVDTSNQITDLYNLSEVNEILTCDGEVETVTLLSPKLLHAISFMEGGEMRDEGVIDMTPYVGPLMFDIPSDKDGYTQYQWIIPTVETLSSENAQSMIDRGAAVIGFDPEDPTDTVKYLSTEYYYKLELAGSTFNPIHRWHQLMDKDPEMAEEYLQHLPYHMKHITLTDVHEAHARQMNKIINTLTVMTVARYNGKDEKIEKKLLNKSNDIMNEIISDVRAKHKRNRPSQKVLQREIEELVIQHILAMSYSERHAFHRTIQRAERTLECQE